MLCSYEKGKGQHSIFTLTDSAEDWSCKLEQDGGDELYSARKP